MDGTVLIERSDENARFYGETIGVADILAGKVRHPPKEIAGLINTLKAAQGDTDIDESVLPSSEPIPSDYEFKEETFGLPSKDDDDPFGVKALEEQGMEIREAGTRQRPSMDAFNFSPSPKSPIYNTFHSRKNSKRDSIPASIASTAKTDMATQTDDLPSPRFTDSPHIESPTSARHDSPVKKTSENLADEIDESSSSSQDETLEPVKTQRISQISQAGATTVSPGKLKVVTIPKRVPPALPPRSPYRSSREGAPLPSPSLIPARRSGDPTQGLGISTSEDMGTQSLYPTSTQDTIPSIERDIVEEKLEQIHTAPSRESGRLSPRRDGIEDLASVSGSEYSRRTSRAETPAMSRMVSQDGESSQLQTLVVESGEPEATASRHVDEPIVLRDAEEVQAKPDSSLMMGAAENTPVMPGGTDWDAEPPSNHASVPEPFSVPAPEQRANSPSSAAVEDSNAERHVAPESSTLQNIRSSLSAEDEDGPDSPPTRIDTTVPAESKLGEDTLLQPSALQHIRSSLHIDDDEDTTTPATQNAAEDDFHSVPQTPVKDNAPPLAFEASKETSTVTRDERSGQDAKEETKTENTKPEISRELSAFEKKRAMFS